MSTTPFEFETPADAVVPFQVVNPPTTEAVAEAQREAEGDEASLGEAASAAFELTNSLAALRRMEETVSEDDPNFVLTKPLLDELTTDIEPEFHPNFAEARSEKHARQIRDRILQEKADAETVASRGWQGVGLMLGAAIADPVALGLSAATGGTVGMLSKAGRLRRFLAAGSLSAAENAAVEALIASSSQTQGIEDVLYSGIGGFILGGGIAALPRAQNDRALQIAEEIADSIDRQLLSKAGVKVAEPLRSTGAAQVRSQPVVPNEFTAEELNAPRTAFGNLRFDIIGRLKSSDHGPTRAFASKLAEDAVGNADRSIPTEIGASEIASNLRARWETQFYRTADGAFDEWLSESQLPWTARYTQRDAFFRAVTEAVRTGNATSPAVAKAAKTMREIYADVLSKAKEAGVFGFENVETNPRYITRLFSQENIRNLDAKYGTAAIEQLLRGAVRSATDVDDELAGKIARGYWKKLRRLGAGLDVHVARSLSPDAQDVLREVLEDSDLPDVDIDRIFAAITPSKEQQPTSRARRRTLLDEDFALKIENPATGEIDTVRVSDLFENNAETIMSSYLSQLSGHVALARKGIRSRREFTKYLEQLQADAIHKGVPQAVAEDNAASLRKLYDAITGAPLESDPMSTYAQVGRLLRDTNFVRVMNQTGLAQATELGNILSHAGIREMLAHIPEFRKMLSRAKSGELADDELADELELWIGLGTDRLRHPVRLQPQERGQAFDVPRLPDGMNKALQKYDTALQYGKRVTADISLMSPIVMAQQRLAMKSIAQKFVNLAHGERKWRKERLAQLGLSPQMTDRILEQIRKHTDTEPSSFFAGRKVKRLNIEKWMADDAEAADAFVMATYRLGRRIIQENDVGAMPLLVHSTLGKLLFEFRTFMLGAWTKQTLSNIHMRDMEAAQSFLFTSLLASTLYMVQASFNSLGRPDAQEYRDERLDPAEIAKASFQRAGWSSLMPATYDTVSTLTFADKPTFAYGRSTGLGSGLLQGNPTVDLLDNAGRATKGVVSSLLRDDYDYSQDDFRAATSLLWFKNAFGVTNAINLLSNNLPEDSRNE